MGKTDKNNSFIQKFMILNIDKAGKKNNDRNPHTPNMNSLEPSLRVAFQFLPVEGVEKWSHQSILLKSL
jgi:hypothetical protein